MTFSAPSFANRFFTVYFVDQDDNEFAIATLDTLEEAKKKLHDHADGLDADAAESVQGFFIEHDEEVVFSTLSDED